MLMQWVLLFAVQAVAQTRNESFACENGRAFEKREITDTASGAWSVFGTDLDGDGDVDVLSASYYDSTIAWYENDGEYPPTFEKVVISDDASGALSVYATDLDGDGDLDVLSASYSVGKIAWYENDGETPPNFEERIISWSAEGAYSVTAADVDGDDILDVLSASYIDGTIAWYKNLGGFASNFVRNVITNEADYAYSVVAVDFDGDGDIDVLSGSYYTIEWYENDGGSVPSFVKRVITDSANAAESVRAVDLDGDGDLDVLSASSVDDTVSWYENDGTSPQNFVRRVITTSAEEAKSVYAVDLDDDGDMDVVMAASFNVTIAWYENMGGSPPKFEERILLPAVIEGRSVFAVDVDGDGDIDLLSASDGDNTVAWYESVCAKPSPTSQPTLTTMPTTAPSPEPTTKQPTGQPTPQGPTMQGNEESSKKKKGSQSVFTTDWFWAMIGSIVALIGLIAPVVAYVCCRKRDFLGSVNPPQEVKREDSLPPNTSFSFSPNITIHTNSQNDVDAVEAENGESRR